LEWSKLSTYEAWVAQRFDNVVVTSEHEKQELLNLDPSLRLEVVANGIDLEYFTPDRLSATPSMIFSGKMSYYANEAAVVFFCRRILPLIRAQIPQATLCIAGNEPSKVVRRLGRHSGVHVTGYVSDLRPLFQRSRVAVCPIVVGAGTQFKVLEALAMGKPVVATSKACRALFVRHGEHLLITDEPQAFAEAVISLLTDDELGIRIGQAGRRYIEQHHAWDRHVSTLEQVYECARRGHKDRHPFQRCDGFEGS
jgi:glycosyltransferase involved in cell wall biosynthesis